MTKGAAPQPDVAALIKQILPDDWESDPLSIRTLSIERSSTDNGWHASGVEGNYGEIYGTGATLAEALFALAEQVQEAKS